MAGRDGEEPKEGVDFKWVKAEGSNAKVRKFFSAAEKAEMGKPKATPKAAPKATPKAATPKPKARQQGRGSGENETVRRQVESGFGTGPKLTRSDSAKPKSITSRKREDGPKGSTRTVAAKPTPKLAKAPKPSGSELTPPRIEEGFWAAPTKRYVTYEDWQKMSRKERTDAGLPESIIGGQLGFNRLLTGITGKDYMMKRK
jgi:hypothetical protein